MLLLQRNVGERIHLYLPSGDKIVLEVIAIREGVNGGERNVRLAFNAPADVLVLRAELGDPDDRSIGTDG